MRAACIGILLACGMLRAGDFVAEYRFTDVRTGAPVDPGPVNADTVEGFELLYATPGTGDVAEIAGHLLLRIKLRNANGDANRDLVVSFLADTADPAPQSVAAGSAPRCRTRNWFNLARAPGAPAEPPLESLWQSLKGLTGGFPVTLDVQTLAYTLKSYTVEQDRSLRRYELILTDARKAGLLDRLDRYARDPKPGYFFFHQNCGSVLVRILGEGIGDAEVAEFSPAVSPPHSLVALLLRRGLARPVEPDFHSFRDRGRLYRTPFRAEYRRMMESQPGPDWPAEAALLSHKAETRLNAVAVLRAESGARPELDEILYPLASLLQEAETVFDPKDRFCRDTTGPVTAELRRWQREMLDRSGALALQAGPPPPPQGPVRRGTDHTGLYRLEAGGGWIEPTQGGSRGILNLSASALRQEMGSESRVAMQRAGAVDLFGADLAVDKEGLVSADWTGLELRKFREGLGEVEAGPWRPRAWGMGLRVLHADWREERRDWRGTLAGISGLLNLASSRDYNHHLWLGAGVDAGNLGSDWGPRMPLELGGLFSAGQTRLRLHGVWTRSWVEDESDFWEVDFRILRPLGEWRGVEWRAVLAMEVEGDRGSSARQVTAGIEALRF